MQTIGRGAAWREAQTLVSHLGQTQPLPRCRPSILSGPSQAQRASSLSDRSPRICEITCNARQKQSPSGWNDCDIDEELWEVLDLATEDELESIHSILYSAFRLFQSFQ